MHKKITHIVFFEMFFFWKYIDIKTVIDGSV